MLFRQQFRAGLVDGSVTVAFRRWKRPSVKAGGTLQSPGGLLRIDAVELIDTADIDDGDARDAGYEDRTAVLADLPSEGTLFRIRFHRLGDDPRVGLRQRTDIDADDLAELRRVLDRLDWALPTLRLIAARPGVVSTELAAQLGFERLVFKQRVRRLKALGLTESLDVGYRLAPRGEALLARLSSGPGSDR